MKIKSFLGGRGVGSWLFYKLGGYFVEPFSPENPLVIASGPLGGTKIPMTTRAYAVFRSPLTGILGCRNALGAVMRRAGVDAVAVVGKAEKQTTG